MTDNSQSGKDGDPLERSSESTESSNTAETSASTDYKVRGRKDAVNGAGVLGKNTATTGSSHGVEGWTDSAEAGSTGVYGEATAGSGAIYGVHGVTRAADNEAKGVRGEVLGDEGWGVAGFNLHDESSEATFHNPAGVFGQTDQGTASWGVLGYNSATSGGGAGIFGSSESPHGAGVWGDNSSGGPAVRASGWVSINEVGIEARQTNPLDVPGDPTTVIYDDEIVDDRSEYDEQAGVFTCAYPGDYHVEAQVRWSNSLPDHCPILLRIKVNGDTEIESVQETAADTVGPTQGISKTLRNLSTGEEITIVADHGDGSTTHSLLGYSLEAQLTISQIG